MPRGSSTGQGIQRPKGALECGAQAPLSKLKSTI